MELSQKEIGHRITTLRKAKGLSQEDLAKRIGLSRPSLAQVELGNRGLGVLELQKLSQVMGFSLDYFFSSNFKPIETVEYTPEIPQAPLERVSVPELQVEKFKNVLLYILEFCAGKANVGETVLYKLLYFCDFNHYELYEEHLTGARYRKLPFGPVPQKLDGMLQQMLEQKLLMRIKTEFHGYPQIRYVPLSKPNLTELSAAEKTVIDHVLQQMSDWTASKISEYSHKDMPWVATEDGEYISYNLAFYRESPYAVRDDED